MIKSLLITAVLVGAALIVYFSWPPATSLKAEPPAQIENQTQEISNSPAPLESGTKTKAPVVEKINYRDDKELKAYINKYGIQKTMAKLIEESRGGSLFDCHQEAHNTGRLGYAVEKEKAFQSCDASCHSGCYHGAMESFLNERGTSNLAQEIDSVCNTFKTSFGIFECLHGVGHGVLAYLDYDLPETINECQKLSSSFSQSSCYGGMFMENILTGQGLGASTKDHSTNWINKTDPYFPCNAIEQNYELQYQCYQMQTSWMLTMSGYNFDTVAQQCLNAQENMRSVCFKSFGRDAAGHTLRDPVKIIPICAKVPQEKDYYNQCITGAVNVIIDFWGPALKTQATQLCRLTSEPHKETCYRVLSGRLNDLFTDNSSKQEICSSFESQYQSLCD